MKLSEYKSALRESARASQDKHAESVQAIIYDHDGNEDSLKEKIKATGASD